MLDKQIQEQAEKLQDVVRLKYKMPSNPTSLELQYVSGLQQGYIDGYKDAVEAQNKNSTSDFYCGEEEDGIEIKCKVQCDACVTPNFKQSAQWMQEREKQNFLDHVNKINLAQRDKDLIKGVFYEFLSLHSPPKD